MSLFVIILVSIVSMLLSRLIPLSTLDVLVVPFPFKSTVIVDFPNISDILHISRHFLNVLVKVFSLYRDPVT
jgi:hypothetical protein